MISRTLAGEFCAEACGFLSFPVSVRSFFLLFGPVDYLLGEVFFFFFLFGGEGWCGLVACMCGLVSEGAQSWLNLLFVLFLGFIEALCMLLWGSL